MKHKDKDYWSDHSENNWAADMLAEFPPKGSNVGPAPKRKRNPPTLRGLPSYIKAKLMGKPHLRKHLRKFLNTNVDYEGWEGDYHKKIVSDVVASARQLQKAIDEDRIRSEVYEARDDEWRRRAYIIDYDGNEIRSLGIY